jgi:hypothetical protein
MIYKTLYKKLKIDQHEPTKKTVGELMSSRIPAPLVASVMLLSSDLVKKMTNVFLIDGCC